MLDLNRQVDSLPKVRLSGKRGRTRRDLSFSPRQEALIAEACCEQVQTLPLERPCPNRRSVETILVTLADQLEIPKKGRYRPSRGRSKGRRYKPPPVIMSP
jgi:hypothetical protein